jgi:hypothetical protein
MNQTRLLANLKKIEELVAECQGAIASVRIRGGATKKTSVVSAPRNALPDYSPVERRGILQAVQNRAGSSREAETHLRMRRGPRCYGAPETSQEKSVTKSLKNS